jgi:hypothetical protein
MRWLRHLTVISNLGLSIYIGFGNTDDITNTITIWQRLIGILATLYAMLAIASLVGYWRISAWLRPILLAWALLVVATSGLAAVVYGASGGSSMVVVALSAVLPALVLWAAHHREQPQESA